MVKADVNLIAALKVCLDDADYTCEDFTSSDPINFPTSEVCGVFTHCGPECCGSAELFYIAEIPDEHIILCPRAEEWFETRFTLRRCPW